MKDLILAVCKIIVCVLVIIGFAVLLIHIFGK